MDVHTKASFSKEENRREKENRQVSYRAACESIVVLRNNGVLPLQQRQAAVFGAGAAHTVKGGTGSGEVNECDSISILQGLRLRGWEISSERWLSAYEEEYEHEYEEFCSSRLSGINFLHPSEAVNEIMKGFQPPAGPCVSAEDMLSSGTDTCLYIVSRQAGEGGDRRLEKGDYYLSDSELQDIRFCAASFDKFILILNTGAPLDTGFLEQVEGIDAVMTISQLGSEGGLAVADVLDGTVTPSGKLADTWPKRYEDIPFAMEYGKLNGNVTEEYYHEGIYVGYRYYDTFRVEPAFPFGFGLSYTEFRLSEQKVRAEASKVTVSVLVTNTGDRFSGKETVQVYVSAPSGVLDREYQSLAAFGKTKLLAPGETQELTMTFDLRELAGYSHADSGFILEKGSYAVRVGTSSRSTTDAAVLVLGKQLQISENRHICPRTCMLSTPESDIKKPKIEGTPEMLILEAVKFPPSVRYDYYTEQPEDPDAAAFVDGLSVKDMVDILVGTGMRGQAGTFNMPGSVGNTTSKFWEKGLINAPLCDGPAGIRLQKESGLRKDGTIRPFSFSMSYMEYYPGFVKKGMLADAKKDTPIYQFCTAFPVASALAQTWNEDLMREVGEAVQKEMEEYGCVFWLAPAINIHRNPLCGRNFEYFSEDPLLTGKLAASMVRGVQCKPGYYVTIKHLACNNQEDNRNKMSSNLSERALREIYLKAFRICVEEADAKAVMTSYNRVNGRYTANSYDLCTDVLRHEWGFSGIVMTDWMSTSPGLGSTAEAIAAGNDLIMPGGVIYKADILSAFGAKHLSKEQIRRCCIRVVQMIRKSALQKELMGQKS